jgi:hypothetical protein
MNESLEKLKKNNPSISYIEETEHINIENLWDDKTFMCRFEKSVDFKLFEKIFFPRELAAIYHEEENKLEIIFSPLDKNLEIITRIFEFYFNNEAFKCKFDEPSEIFNIIANGFREVDNSSDTDYRFLRRFRDFYKQDQLPKFIQKHFENNIPINFFISGDFTKIKNDFVSLAKHLNFYMNYFDRESPTIIIFESDSEEIDYDVPCLTKENAFPELINFANFDPILLDLFQISRRTTNLRLQFIFYFQVLEYCAYYHLNDELKKKLTNIIKRPDILNNTNNYSKLLIEEFKDYFRQNDDSIKLEKLLLDFCKWEDIKLEIQIHREYFAKELEFEGGLKINSIINENETFETEPKGIIKNIKTNIEKIRNVLVHLRESRENKVILPTPKNNNLLIPYLHLIKRIAEKIAIQHE